MSSAGRAGQGRQGGEGRARSYVVHTVGFRERAVGKGQYVELTWGPRPSALTFCLTPRGRKGRQGRAGQVRAGQGGQGRAGGQ